MAVPQFTGGQQILGAVQQLSQAKEQQRQRDEYEKRKREAKRASQGALIGGVLGAVGMGALAYATGGASIPLTIGAAGAGYGMGSMLGQTAVGQPPPPEQAIPTALNTAGALSNVYAAQQQQQQQQQLAGALQNQVPGPTQPIQPPYDPDNDPYVLQDIAQQNTQIQQQNAQAQRKRNLMGALVGMGQIGPALQLSGAIPSQNDELVVTQGGAVMPYSEARAQGLTAIELAPRSTGRTPDDPLVGTDRGVMRVSEARATGANITSGLPSQSLSAQDSGWVVQRGEDRVLAAEAAGRPADAPGMFLKNKAGEYKFIPADVGKGTKPDKALERDRNEINRVLAESGYDLKESNLPLVYRNDPDDPSKGYTLEPRPAVTTEKQETFLVPDEDNKKFTTKRFKPSEAPGNSFPLSAVNEYFRAYGLDPATYDIRPDATGAIVAINKNNPKDTTTILGPGMTMNQQVAAAAAAKKQATADLTLAQQKEIADANRAQQKQLADANLAQDKAFAGEVAWVIPEKEGVTYFPKGQKPDTAGAALLTDVESIRKRDDANFIILPGEGGGPLQTANSQAKAFALADADVSRIQTWDAALKKFAPLTSYEEVQAAQAEADLRQRTSAAAVTASLAADAQAQNWVKFEKNLELARTQAAISNAFKADFLAQNREQFNRRTNIQARQQAWVARQANIKGEDDIRAEVTTLTKAHRELTRNMEDIRAINPDNVTPPQLDALVFKWNKMLDPISVVREGEYARTQALGSLMDRMENLFSKHASGDFLKPHQIRDMQATAYSIQQNSELSVQAGRDYYEKLAKDRGLDPVRALGPNLPKANQAAPAGGALVPETREADKPGGALELPMTAAPRTAQPNKPPDQWNASYAETVPIGQVTPEILDKITDDAVLNILMERIGAGQ